MDDDGADDVAARIATALNKLGLAARQAAWGSSPRLGLTPTQGQILAYLNARRDAQRLGELAAALGATSATVSDAVAALVQKELVVKRQALDDRRAAAIELTPAGREVAGAATGWADLMLAVVDDLDDRERAALLRGLIKMIRGLQLRGQIPVARMCVSCVHFRPNVHLPPARHHCAFVDAPFGDAQLRPDCGDYVPAAPEHARELWDAFASAS